MTVGADDGYIGTGGFTTLSICCLLPISLLLLSLLDFLLFFPMFPLDTWCPHAIL